MDRWDPSSSLCVIFSESYPFCKVLFQSYNFLTCSPVIDRDIALCYLRVVRIFVACHEVTVIWSFVWGSRTYRSPLPRDSYISPVKFHRCPLSSTLTFATHVYFQSTFWLLLFGYATRVGGTAGGGNARVKER